MLVVGATWQLGMAAVRFGVRLTTAEELLRARWLAAAPSQ